MAELTWQSSYSDQDGLLREFYLWLFFSFQGNVAFYAYLTERTELTDNSIVIFDNVVTNYGDAYSDISGTFTGKRYSSLFVALFWEELLLPAHLVCGNVMF